MWRFRAKIDGTADKAEKAKRVSQSPKRGYYISINVKLQSLRTWELIIHDLLNITTNDVFYRRQLSLYLYSFTFLVLSTKYVYVYTYDETVVKRGSDDVCSILFHFIRHSVQEDVENLDLFCYGCAWQNKNWTVISFFYYFVHKIKLFKSITVHFLVAGLFYMVCDCEMSQVNQKTKAETKTDWEEAIWNDTKNPTSFTVIFMTQNMFLEFTDGLKQRALFRPVLSEKWRSTKASSSCFCTETNGLDPI